MAINRNTTNFQALTQHLEKYLDGEISKLEADAKKSFDVINKISSKFADLENTQYTPPPGNPIWYAKTWEIRNLYGLLTYVFDTENTNSNLRYQSRYENITGQVETDPITKSPLTDLRSALAKEMPPAAADQINKAAGGVADINEAIKLTDNVRKYHILRYVRQLSWVYAQLAVGYILDRYTKDEVQYWVPDNVDAALTKPDAGLKPLEFIGWSIPAHTSFYGDGNPSVLDANPWEKTYLLLSVLNDELGIIATLPPKSAITDTAPKTEEIPDPQPKKQAVVRDPIDPTKFTLTLSAFTRDWATPPEFKSGVPANSDLNGFFVFVGKEQKERQDELSNYEDIGFDELDEEYIEDKFEFDPDVLAVLEKYTEVSLDIAAQAVFGNYSLGSDYVDDGSFGNVPAGEVGFSEGWTGDVYYNMRQRRITIKIGGRTMLLKVWNTQAKGGDKRLNLLKAYTAGHESGGSYDSYNWGYNGKLKKGESVFGFQNGYPSKSKRPNSSPLGDKGITDFTWGEIMKRSLYKKRPGVWATGKYQLLAKYIPDKITKKIIKKDEMASPESQERIGDQLFRGWTNINNYIYGVNKGSKNDLSLAIYDTAQCWASLPTTKFGADIEKSPGSRRGAYGGDGINPALTDRNIGMTAWILIETRKAFGHATPYLPGWYQELTVNWQEF